jgi:hypothetical protein
MLYLKETPRLRDVRAVAYGLRKADAEEAQALTGEDPVKAVFDSFGFSRDAFVIRNGQSPVAIGGVVDFHDQGPGWVWMVGTPLLMYSWVEFVRASREVFERYAARYGTLTNFVSLHNTAHVRWLKWLGCEFEDTVLSNGVPFQRFTYVYGRNAPHNRHAGRRASDRLHGPVEGREGSG